MQKIADIEQLMIEAGIVELELRSPKLTLSLKLVGRKVAAPQADAPSDEATREATRRNDVDSRNETTRVMSPHVGIFQPRHATRKQAPLVTGASVASGETLGFVRDGLILYPIVAPIDATVSSLLLEAGAPVGYGTPLVELLRSA